MKFRIAIAIGLAAACFSGDVAAAEPPLALGDSRVVLPVALRRLRVDGRRRRVCQPRRRDDPDGLAAILEEHPRVQFHVVGHFQLKKFPEIAARLGHFDAVNLLLGRGADVHADLHLTVTDALRGGKKSFRIPASVACPRCGATATELVSEFGSTACKASYRCSECLEPFEYFKCI